MDRFLQTACDVIGRKRLNDAIQEEHKSLVTNFIKKHKVELLNIISKCEEAKFNEEIAEFHINLIKYIEMSFNKDVKKEYPWLNKIRFTLESKGWTFIKHLSSLPWNYERGRDEENYGERTLKIFYEDTLIFTNKCEASQIIESDADIGCRNAQFPKIVYFRNHYLPKSEFSKVAIPLEKLIEIVRCAIEFTVIDVLYFCKKSEFEKNEKDFRSQFSFTRTNEAYEKFVDEINLFTMTLAYSENGVSNVEEVCGCERISFKKRTKDV